MIFPMLSGMGWTKAKGFVMKDKNFINAEKQRNELAELRAVQRERSFLKWAKRALVVGGLWLVGSLVWQHEIIFAVFITAISVAMFIGINVADAEAFLRETEIMNRDHHHGGGHGDHATHGAPTAGHQPPANNHAPPPVVVAVTPPPIPAPVAAPPPIPPQRALSARQRPQLPAHVPVPPPIPAGPKKTK